MFFRISSSTRRSPARASGGRPLLADDPDRGGERGGRQRTLAVPHLGPDGPGAHHHEAGPDQRGHQGLPSIRLLVREDDHQAAIFAERRMESAEGARHAVFVALLRGGTVATEAARIVDQLAVALVRAPLGSQRLGECGVGLRRQPVQHPAQPDMEEVHEVRVGDGVVVGRVGADQVDLFVQEGDRALACNCRLGRHLGGGDRVDRSTAPPIPSLPQSLPTSPRGDLPRSNPKPSEARNGRTCCGLSPGRCAMNKRCCCSRQAC